MDPKAQKSFIPQKSVLEGPKSSGFSGGLLYLLGVILFIATLLAAVGVFAYGKFLEGRIAKMQTDLEIARENLNPELIGELSRANARFSAAEKLIKEHRTLSTFFALLEQNTLKSVRFTTFGYDDNPAGIMVNMNGEANSYKILASQAALFSDQPLFKSTSFSGLDLSEKGSVTFSTSISLDSKAVSYEQMINSIYGNVSPTSPQTISPQNSTEEVTSEVANDEENQPDQIPQETVSESPTP